MHKTKGKGGGINSMWVEKQVIRRWCVLKKIFHVLELGVVSTEKMMVTTSGGGATLWFLISVVG